MKTKTVAVQPIDLSIGHKMGIGLGSIPEREADIIAGFRVARDPDLVELRKAENIAVRASIKATLLSSYKG